MNELEKYLPTPPDEGPPLPRILQARWPWVKQPSEAPKPRAAESPRSPSVSYVDVNDGLLKASTEKFRAEQREKGLVPFYYE